METYTDTSGNVHKIHVEETGNPTPCRDWDYCAATDNYDGAPDAGPQLTGTGSTPAKAIADLIDCIEGDL